MYLDYEGPISGDRGSVSRWDRGFYQLVTEGADLWRARLRGERLVLDALFERDGHQRWSVSFLPSPAVEAEAGGDDDAPSPTVSPPGSG